MLQELARYLATRRSACAARDGSDCGDCDDDFLQPSSQEALGPWEEPPGWVDPPRIVEEEDLDAGAGPERLGERSAREIELGIADDVDWVMGVLCSGSKPLIRRCFFNARGFVARFIESLLPPRGESVRSPPAPDRADYLIAGGATQMGKARERSAPAHPPSPPLAPILVISSNLI